MKNLDGLKKLQLSFLKLSDAKQEYILGVAEGLKYGQGKFGNCLRASPYADNQSQTDGRDGSEGLQSGY